MGDLVILNEDEDFVEEQIRKFYKGDRIFNKERARSLLGNTFSIVPTESKKFDDNWVLLLCDNGEKVYFPKTTLMKVEQSK